MSEILHGMKAPTRLQRLFLILLVVFVSSSAAQDHRYYVHPWSFGVMGDTQWTLGAQSGAVDPAGDNPNSVSVSIIRQLDQQFISHGVKFVVGLGDNSNSGDDAAKITTGWIARPAGAKLLKSSILSLWGMTDPGADKSDTYTLSMTFKDKKHLRDGSMGIAIVDASGKWVNAVNANSGGSKKFVAGPFKAEYGLGTYGIDPRTKTAWAVINYNADFAVATDIEPAAGQKR